LVVDLSYTGSYGLPPARERQSFFKKLLESGADRRSRTDPVFHRKTRSVPVTRRAESIGESAPQRARRTHARHRGCHAGR